MEDSGAQMAPAPAWRVCAPRELRGELPLTSHWKEHIGAAFVALFHGDSLLLVQGLSGRWQLPGGLVDTTDENVWDTACREYFEETGSVAPLPANELAGWFATSIDWGEGAFHGAIFVLRTHTSNVPFAANAEMKALEWVPWAKLEELDFRWPNDETIPKIHDESQSIDGCRANIKVGPWNEMRPALHSTGGLPERVPSRDAEDSMTDRHMRAAGEEASMEVWRGSP